MLNKTMITIILFTIGVMACCYFLAKVLARSLTRDLTVVNNSVCAIIESGKLDQKIIIYGRDEIAQLGNNFNQMIDRLREAFK